MKGKSMRFGLVAGMVGLASVLAGCQAEGLRFQIKDQRVPEQVGLRIEPLGDFGQDASLKGQPVNYGRYYLEHGELDLRLLRITNITGEPRQVYPTIVVGQGASAVLSQFYLGTWPRDRYVYEARMEPPFPSLAEVLYEYRSEFDSFGAVLEFAGGAREKIAMGGIDENPKPIELRAGESAVFRLRLTLRRDSPIASDPVPGCNGRCFMPPGMKVDPATRPLRVEGLIGARIELRSAVTLLALDPKTEELNPVYLGGAFSAFDLFRDANGPVPKLPPEKVAQTIPGLAVQE